MMIDELIQNQSTTMITAALLGLRKHQTNKVAFEARDMTLRVTPEVLLWLTVYKYGQLRANQTVMKKAFFKGQFDAYKKENDRLTKQARSVIARLERAKTEAKQNELKSKLQMLLERQEKNLALARYAIEQLEQVK